MGQVAAGARWPWGRSLALLLVVAGGCGHAATPAQPPAAAAVANRQDPFSATLAWWPSQLPDSASIWLHVKAPAVDLPRLAKLAPPTADRDLRDPARLATMALGSEIAGLIDLQGPLDLLTSAAPAPLTLAFSVSSPAVVKNAAAARWLRPLGPARWALSPPGGGRPGMSCQVWHLAAPVGFRILCSNDASALNRDGPLLLGRLAKRAIDARVRIEILEPFLAAHWARETAPASAGRSDDDAGQRLGTELTKELFEGASLAVSTNLAEPDLDLVIELTYRTLAGSPILAAWLRSSASPPPVPPELWRLPADSRIALAFAGTDSRTATETFESLFSRFVQGFRSSSSSPPASEAEVQSLFDPIRDVLPNQGRSVIALGPAPATGAHPLVGDVTGWLILGGATDSATIRARLERILAAQRRDVGGERAPAERAGQRRPATPASGDRCAFETAAKKPPGLPAGSELWVCAPAAPGAKKSGPAAPSPGLLMIPARDWSWVIVAADVPTALTLADRLGRDGDSLGKRRDVVRALGGGTPAMVGLIDLAALFDSAARTRLWDGSGVRAAAPFPVRLTVKDTPEAVILEMSTALSPAARAQVKTVSYERWASSHRSQPDNSSAAVQRDVPAPSGRPEDVFQGKIVVTKERLPQRFPSASAFVNTLRERGMETVTSNGRSGNELWHLEYIAFFAEPLRSEALRISFRDLNDHDRVVADDTLHIREVGSRMFSASVELHGPAFKPFGHYRMTLESGGTTVASTPLWLFGAPPTSP